MRRSVLTLQIGGAATCFLMAGALMTGAFGGWTDSDSAGTPVQFGTVNLGLANSTLTTALGDTTTGLAPSDVLYRYVDFTNTGANALAIKDVRMWVAIGSITDPISPTATAADIAGDVQVTVDTCSVAWNQTTNACAGTTTNQISARYLTSLDTSGEASSNIVLSSLAIGATSYARFTFTVDSVASATTALEGASAPLTWAFLSDSRAAVTTM